MAEIEIPSTYQTIKTQLQNLVKRWHYTKSETDTLLNGKVDNGDAVTSIELVPKSQDSTGAIKLYYGDESWV